MDINMLCPSCMREKPVRGKPCPFCGYDEDKESNAAWQLPVWTVLQGAYLVGKALGDGGFGITYAACDMNLQKKVAIKEYFPYRIAGRSKNGKTVQCANPAGKAFFEAEKERFVTEARILAGLDEQNGVVKVNYFFYENGTAYIVMEFIEGRSLLKYAHEKGGALKTEEALALLQPVVAALSGIHAKGVVHKDISLDNIIVTPDGRARLIDFGAAFRRGSNDTQLKVYKESYSPVEQITGRDDVGAWSDIYALCATMYHMITGVKPVSAVERARGVTLKKPSERGVKIDALTEAALMNGLEIEPKDRIRDAADLYYFLYQYGNTAGASAAGLQSKVKKSAPQVLLQQITEEKKRERTRNKILYAGLVALVLMVSFFLVRIFVATRTTGGTPVASVGTSQPDTPVTAVSASAKARPTTEELGNIRAALYEEINGMRRREGEEPLVQDGLLEKTAADAVSELVTLDIETSEGWSRQIIASVDGAVRKNNTGECGWLVLPVHDEKDVPEVLDEIIRQIAANNTGVEHALSLSNCRMAGIAIGMHTDGTLFYAVLYR